MRFMSVNRAPLAAAATIAAAGLAVSACGSSTVDSSEVTSTQTSTSTVSTGSAESSASSSAAASSQTTARSSEPAGAPADQPAKEVDSMPATAAAYSEEETAYLEALRNGGINVHGVEDQLTGTGFNVCQGATITRDAVAGQLVEQRRTDLDPTAAAKLIDDTAHAHLC